MPIVLSTSWEAAAIASVGAKMPAPKSRQWQQTAGRFLFKHRRSVHHLQNMSELHGKMKAAVESSIPVSDASEEVHSGYSGPLLEKFQFDLDGFFEALRSAHDASLSCLGSANLLIDPPHSFHDFYKKHERKEARTRASDDGLLDLLLTFWTATGQLTKSYRDCLSHYVSLAGPTWQHSANAVFRRGAWTLSISLPDNPAARTYRALEFSGAIEALALCQRLQRDSDSFVHEVLLRCIDKWGAGPLDSGMVEMEITNVVVGG